MALAAQATERLRIATAVAMAFPRSPTIHRDERLDLQKLPRGRFSLGDLCDSAMSRQETCRRA
jgi:alkanesulfonate monooxygenase SsuD/methylene tetrahydromethanopterin reductase-like flavin-dependent oxidoreductase (luciferase family)